jgi:MoxR-like ATPase
MTNPVTSACSTVSVKMMLAEKRPEETANRVDVAGVELVLATPDQHDMDWLDFDHCAQRLEAAWLRLSPKEPPLNPRVIGEPGLGKTTLACAVARRLGQPVYIFQCTMDTRPEDLIVTPVLTPDRRVEYHASSVVSAMLTGGIAILDEGNRMPERAWASLAPLMDDRRYVESTIASVKVPAHPQFRMCVTMNQDASVYELPGYIQSRLKPKIEIVAPPWEMQERILLLKCPHVDAELLTGVFKLLKSRVKRGLHDSTRDMLSLAQYAQKLKITGVSDPLKRASEQVLEKTRE